MKKCYNYMLKTPQTPSPNLKHPSFLLPVINLWIVTVSCNVYFIYFFSSSFGGILGVLAIYLHLIFQLCCRSSCMSAKHIGMSIWTYDASSINMTWLHQVWFALTHSSAWRRPKRTKLSGSTRSTQPTLFLKKVMKESIPVWALCSGSWWTTDWRTKLPLPKPSLWGEQEHQHDVRKASMWREHPLLTCCPNDWSLGG